MTSPYGPSTATPFALSGNSTIDALVNWGVKWGGGGVGTSAVVTYSFPQINATWLDGYGMGEPVNGFQGFTAAQQNAARQALSLWSDVANITFQQVPDTAVDVGDIRFGFSRAVTNSPFIAWGYFPEAYPEAGDIWFDRSYGPNLQMAPGQFGFSTLLHEIGHAIGLDHPFDDGAGEPVLPASMDNNQYTIMAYDLHPTASVEAMSPMLLDILAIQHLYGANMTTRTGDDVYKFSTSEQLRAIWDAGGIDTIDAGNQTLGAIINLNEGTFSSIGRRNAGGSAHDNIAIAYGVTIENAKGGSGSDKIFGNAVNNVLTGNAGNDTLDGGIGADTLRGGQGLDIYVVDNAGDVVDEQGNKDLGDEVRIATSINLAMFAGGLIERATALGNAAIDLVGNKAANILIGNAATNIINGGAGADVMKGGAGNDIYFVDIATDQIDEGSNKDSSDEVVSTVTVNIATLGKGQIEVATLVGTAAINATGNALDNLITGNSAANTLNGAGGDDMLRGLEGNDTLTDTLGNNHLEGGNGNDRLTGGAGRDTLIGGGGNDVMNGGTGNDTYFVDSANDKITDSGTTDLNDRVMASISVDLTKLAAGLLEHVNLLGMDALTATGNARNNVIAGNAGANILIGDLGNDVLDGGLGADKMLGGQGNDVYIVDDLGDVVDEQGSTDTADHVTSSVTIDLALLAAGAIEHGELFGVDAADISGNAVDNKLWGNGAANILDGRDGNDTLTGQGGTDSLIGGIGNDLLDGGTGDDTLIGGAGNDSLDGGVGADVLKGGEGNDIYFVDTYLDTIDEKGHQDTADEVRASISVDLSVLADGAIENATAIEGALATTLTGNSSANLLIGNSGMNFLDGAGGSDTMRGGAGSDFYTIDSLNDVIDEQGNQDINDEVRSSVLSLDLTSLAGAAIENARLSGSGNHNITGNSAGNFLIGNDGDNTIDGRAGNDILLGGIGNDVLISGDGSDQLNGDIGDDLLVVPTIIEGQHLIGGSGFDELKITAGGATIDLRSISDSVVWSIESIDLTGAGNNQLIASAKDISSLLTGGGSSLFIKGDVGDSLILTDSVSFSGPTVIDGVAYKSYSYGSSTIYVNIDVAGPAAPLSKLHLADITDAAGFRINGNDSSNGFGLVISGVGDVNHDGFEDVVTSGGLTAYLIYGDGGPIDGPVSAKNPVGLNVAELSVDSNWQPIVSSLGDFNGDGIDDLAVGDPGFLNRGAAYVIYGQTSVIDQLALKNLDAASGTTIAGTAFGTQVTAWIGGLSKAGDVNGDGYDDLLTGSTVGDAAYVFFGRADQPGSISMLDGNNGFAINGYTKTLVGGGDFNGDGYDDVLVNDGNLAHLVFGHQGAFTAQLQASDLNGVDGFTIAGATTVLAAGGDFNGDGYDDFVLSNPQKSVGGMAGAGSAYVVFGKGSGFTPTFDISQLNGLNGFELSGIQANQLLGQAASISGDYNGDGYDDLLIGAPGILTFSVGSAYVVYGHANSNSASMSVTDLDGINGFQVVGVSTFDQAGAGATSSDINGDGFDDLIVGAQRGNGDAFGTGNAHVIYGKDPLIGTIVGSDIDNTLAGAASGDNIVGGQGNDTINGTGGADAINGGQGDDEIHVADNEFFRIDGGTGVDALHLDYAGAIDFGNLDGNASTSDRNRIENVETIDVDNGYANALTLHLADVLDLDVTSSNLGGVAGLDNVLRIDGNAGDALKMFNVDGWGAADTSSLTGYAVYTYQAVKVAVDTDIAVSMT